MWNKEFPIFIVPDFFYLTHTHMERIKVRKSWFFDTSKVKIFGIGLENVNLNYAQSAHNKSPYFNCWWEIRNFMRNEHTSGLSDRSR